MIRIMARAELVLHSRFLSGLPARAAGHHFSPSLPTLAILLHPHPRLNVLFDPITTRANIREHPLLCVKTIRRLM